MESRAFHLKGCGGFFFLCALGTGQILADASQSYFIIVCTGIGGSLTVVFYYRVHWNWRMLHSRILYRVHWYWRMLHNRILLSCALVLADASQSYYISCALVLADASQSYFTIFCTGIGGCLIVVFYYFSLNVYSYSPEIVSTTAYIYYILIFINQMQTSCQRGNVLIQGHLYVSLKNGEKSIYIERISGSFSIARFKRFVC